MTGAVMDVIPESVREALETTSRRYGLYCRRSREAAEEALEIGRVLLWIKEQINHGLWMPVLKAMKISYDAAARHMRLVRRGATVEMIQEHGVTGALMLLSQPRAHAPSPEPAAEEAISEASEFGSTAKFDRPLPELEPTETRAPEPDSGPQETAAGPASESVAEGDADAIQTAWRTMRERLLAEIGEGHFKSWIEPCRIEARGAGATLLAPTRFMRDRVQQIYGERIRELWHQELPDIELTFEIGGSGHEPQQRLPLSGGRAAATAGNVTLALSPKTAQGNAPGLRLAAAAAAVGDRRLRVSTKLMLVSCFWRYWPGRPLRGDVEQMGAPSGLKANGRLRSLRAGAQIRLFVFGQQARTL